MNTIPTNVSGPASESPACTAPIRTPVATAISAGSSPRRDQQRPPRGGQAGRGDEQGPEELVLLPGPQPPHGRRRYRRARPHRTGVTPGLSDPTLTPVRRRSAGRAESLDADAVHGHAEVDEEMARGVGEAGRAAHVGLGVGPDVRLEVGRG